MDRSIRFDEDSSNADRDLGRFADQAASEFFRKGVEEQVAGKRSNRRVGIDEKPSSGVGVLRRPGLEKGDGISRF